MPPMPPMPPISGISGPESGLGSSATKVSVVRTSPPIEPADWRAFLVTLTGSITPASSISTYSLVRALYP